jgi:hypothetical protein
MTKKRNTVGYRKVIQRDKISGLWQANDVAPGEWSVGQLEARADARLVSMTKAVENDWPSSMLDTTSEAGDATYGNVLGRMPKPSDSVEGSGDRFGVSVTPGEQGKKAPRDNSE